MKIVDFINLVALGVGSMRTDGSRLDAVSAEFASIVGESLQNAGIPMSVSTHWPENSGCDVEFNMCLEDMSGKLLKAEHDLRLTIFFDTETTYKWGITLVADDKDDGVDESYGLMELNRGEFDMMDNNISIAVTRFLKLYEEKKKDDDPSRSVGVQFMENNRDSLADMVNHMNAVIQAVEYNKMRLYEDTDTGNFYIVPEVVVVERGAGGLDLGTFPKVKFPHGRFSSSTDHFEVMKID